MGKTASSKSRTARAPHKPLKPFPPSPHPATYIAISTNLTTYNPQPGFAPPDCIDMGVTIFHGKLPEWSDERADTSLAQLMTQAECHHVINKKHRNLNAPVRYGSEALTQRTMLYKGIYAKTRILENEDEIKSWLCTLIQERQNLIDESKSSSSSPHHRPRNLVLMDWATSGTDRLLQRWGIIDRLGLKTGNDRVQFWDLRQWDRMAQLAPNPCSNPRDISAPLKALGIDRTNLDTCGGMKDNAGNDAWHKLAIYLSFHTMTSEEEAAIMVTGKPLVRSPPIELEQDPEILEANQRLYSDMFEARDSTEGRMLPRQERDLQRILDMRLAQMVSIQVPTIWDRYPPSKPTHSPPKVSSPERKTEETRGEEPGALEMLNSGWDSSSQLTFDMAPLVPTKLT